jgi:hypothetical protein
MKKLKLYPLVNTTLEVVQGKEGAIHTVGWVQLSRAKIEKEEVLYIGRRGQEKPVMISCVLAF